MMLFYVREINHSQRQLVEYDSIHHFLSEIYKQDSTTKLLCSDDFYNSHHELLHELNKSIQ